MAIPYFILGVALLLGVFLIIRGLLYAEPRQVLKVLGAAGGVLVAAFLLFLAATGRLYALLGLVPMLLPFILNWRHFMRRAKAARGPRPGQTSTIRTHYLEMTLDHDTGALGGRVLQGAYSGSSLADLDETQLASLLDEARHGDPDSAELLETYLDRRFGAGWRGGPESDSGDETGGDSRRQSSGDEARSGAGDGKRSAQSGLGSMTREEAYAILGLEPGASHEDIKAAHRRLMLKLHPDQGGTNYLAARINQAKDLLIQT